MKGFGKRVRGIDEQQAWIIVCLPFDLFPVDNGAKQRIFALLTFLCKHYRVGLVLPGLTFSSECLLTCSDAVWGGGGMPGSPGFVHRNFLKLHQRRMNRKYGHLWAPYSDNLFVRRDDYLAGTIERLLDKLHPIAVIAEYVWSVVPLAPLARSRSIPVLLDTHDVQSLRRERELSAGVVPRFDFGPESEKQLFAACDILIAIQENEGKVLKTFGGGKPVIVAEHPFEAFGLPPSAVESQTVLFVGSRAAHNLHGLQAFIEHQWPRILTECPSAKLRVVGSVCEAMPLCYGEVPGVEMGGFSADLKQEYSRAAVVINPILYGSGLKIKSVEALAAGRVLVSCPLGVDGMESAAGEAFIVTDFEQMHNEVVFLLRDPDRRWRLEAGARLLLERRFLPDACFSGLKAYLDSLTPHTEVE